MLGNQWLSGKIENRAFLLLFSVTNLIFGNEGTLNNTEKQIEYNREDAMVKLRERSKRILNKLAQMPKTKPNVDKENINAKKYQGKKRKRKIREIGEFVENRGVKKIKVESPRIEVDGRARADPETVSDPLTDTLYSEYGRDIIKNMIDSAESYCLEKFLDNHQITPKLRACMINWMIEIGNVLMNSDRRDNDKNKDSNNSNTKVVSNTFYLAVQIMDRYGKERTKEIQIRELHILGITALFLASKMEDSDPLSLNTVYFKVGHKKISK